MFNKFFIVDKQEASRIITEMKFHVVQDIWHYSFNEELVPDKFTYCYRKNGIHLLYTFNDDAFAPTLLYSNNQGLFQHKIDKGIIANYNKCNGKQRKVFWFLHLDTFHDFLKRRTIQSKNPKKHFPSLYTYDKTSSKIDSAFSIDNFDKNLFIEQYNILKKKSYLDGNDIYNLFKKRKGNIPNSWLKTAILSRNNNIKCIALLIDDGKSISLENIAAERSRYGYGVYLCTKLVEYFSNRKYYSFDAGLSGIYGPYKNKIFLDSKEIYTKKVINYHTVKNKLKNTVTHIMTNKSNRLWSMLL